MKALKYYNNRDLKFEQIDTPEPNKDEIRINVTDVGLCQTQINEFVEGPLLLNKEPHPLTSQALPFIPGHEYGGIVDKVGDESLSHLVGKQVAVLPLLSCGECEYCKSGKVNLCDKLAYYGLLGAHGGLADYSVVKKENIIPIEKKELLTYIEPILLGIHIDQMLKEYKQGEKILILGAGAIGIAVASVLKDYGKKEVYLTDFMENRLLRASNGGFNTLQKESLEPKKYEYVIDCAGSDTYSKTSAIIEAFEYVKKAGTIIGAGTYFHPISIETLPALISEQKLLWAFTYNNLDVKCLPTVVDTLKTNFTIFNEYIELDNIIDDGYLRAEVDKDSFTRLIVRC